MEQTRKPQTARQKLTTGAVIAGILVVFFILRALEAREEPRPVAQAAAPAIPKPAQPSPPPAPEDERARLALDYLILVEGVNPHLNFIQVKTVKVKGGFQIWLTHAYFTKNTFSIGDTGKVVQTWLHNNGAALRRAGVLRIGVKNDSGYLGSCWFDL